MCGCGKKKEAVTSVQLAQQEQATREQQDPDVLAIALLRERRSALAAINNSRS